MRKFNESILGWNKNSRFLFPLLKKPIRVCICSTVVISHIEVWNKRRFIVKIYVMSYWSLQSGVKQTWQWQIIATLKVFSHCFIDFIDRGQKQRPFLTLKSLLNFSLNQMKEFLGLNTQLFKDFMHKHLNCGDCSQLKSGSLQQLKTHFCKKKKKSLTEKCRKKVWIPRIFS